MTITADHAFPHSQAYGPDQGDITVLAIEPHPEDQKRGAYERIKLSALPHKSTRKT